MLAPLKATTMNLASIPDSIRTDALINTTPSVGPQKRLRSISTRRHSETIYGQFKPKKVEDIEVILNRVVRAKCCLVNQQPEQDDVMKRAVGDSSADFMRAPGRKALRIRLKFLQNQFLQNTTEDFMSTQNLQREVDNTIVTTSSMFA